jgi:hypothetical protein
MHFLLCSAKLQLHRTCIIFSVIRFQTNFLDETMELFRALRNPPWEKTELRYVQWMAETKEKIEHVLLFSPMVDSVVHEIVPLFHLRNWFGNE